MCEKNDGLFNLPILPAVMCAGVLMVTEPASAEVFNVTKDFWGAADQEGTFAWAIHEANARANATDGPDTITVEGDLEISVDSVDPTTFSEGWLATITESVRIEGNGATLIGDPAYVTSGGETATKTSIVASRYGPAIVGEDVIVTPAFSFARIGTRDADNSSIKVDITDLGADGLASIAETRPGATLSVTGGEFTNLVNYTDANAVGRGVFQAEAGATLNISDVSISKHYPFDTAIDVGPDAVAFFGSIIGEDAQLNLQNSSISGSFGAGAIAWSGGEANIVSSVVEDAGGISISDSENKKGELNFVNSILYMTGGDDLSQTNRIQVAGDAVANVIASSVLFDALFVREQGCDEGIAYACNGMPLTATLDGVLNFNSSVAVALNAELAFPEKESYSEFSGGDLLADDFSFIQETPTQDGSTIRSLFDNPDIQTSGDTFEIGGDDSISLFLPLPEGATPVFGGALWRFVNDAGIGGENALVNPIDGSRILFDVYGNERVSSSGHRDIGAVQALAPVPLPSSLLLLMGGVGALLMKGSRRRCRLCLPFGFSSHAALRSDPGAKALMTVIPGRHSTVPDHAERNHNHGVRTMTLYSRKTATILLAALLPFGLAACDGSASTSSRPAMAASCPSDLGGNECEYYMDGYRAGADDGAMGMSMAYQRHEGYDSRFEPYFARGYEAGWTQTR